MNIMLIAIVGSLGLALVAGPGQAGTPPPVSPDFGAYMGTVRTPTPGVAANFDGKAYALDPAPILTASDVKSVELVMDTNTGVPEIRFVLNDAAGQKLASASRGHIGKPMCLKVGATIVSCAVIQGVIGKEFVTTFPDVATADAQYKALTNKH